MSSNPFNELRNESSPYLLQHANNPVNWMAWNEKSWKKAVDEDKLVIVSIGYSACHWCHVMEHESFEDEQVAEIMNDHFISIKVDREERPDVDQIYMDAVQLIRGQGGWPLNAITLPNGKPVYAGTYFQKENWKQVLLYFVNEKKLHNNELYQRADEITENIVRMDSIYTSQSNVTLNPEIRNQMLLEFTKSFDVKFGGRTGAPKFVMPDNYRFLLQLYRSSGYKSALEMTHTTLLNISLSGLNDQVGGGFCRYSVDAYWNIPHFEKMLYDNAQLMSLFSDAFRISKEPEYYITIEQIFSFLQREMLAPEGSFYSALDADSEGEEGKFYVWSWEELNEILRTEIDPFRKYYECSQQGNFEGHNHLARRGSVSVLSERWGESEETVSNNIQRWMNILFEKRKERISPGLDDKILTSWNALMITGLADAYIALNENKFKEAALRCSNFITSTCINEQEHLFRTYKNGSARIHGFLDDYALCMEAFIKMYQITADEKWLTIVQKLLHIVMDEFWDESSGFFFYTSRLDPALIARKKEMSDNVISSSNAVMAEVLYVIGQLLYNDHYLNISKKMVIAMQEMYSKHPVFYSRWAKVADYWIEEPELLIIAGSKALEAQLKIYEENRNALIFPCLKESNIPSFLYKFQAKETLMYICKDKSCQTPEVLG